MGLYREPTAEERAERARLYELRIAQEKAEEAAHRAWVADVAVALTEVDGQAWSVVDPWPGSDGYSRYDGTCIAPSDGSLRALSLATDHLGKVPVSSIGEAAVPHDVSRSAVADPKMRVSSGRDPMAVARDIARRGLPGFRAHVAACREAMASAAEREGKREALAERFVALGARRVKFQDARSEYVELDAFLTGADRTHGLTLTVGNTSVSVKSHSVDHATAERVLSAFLAG